ncbi:MAG TPA: acyl-CoA dehydrogenase family protein [Acidimicrobiales bacterium]|nr:acyl-CoA dehydrogenase family protein [Acidimicrobiales bacterium]
MAEDVRDEVRAWLAESWDAERPLLEWRSLLADAGWGCPTWPLRWFGRGLDAAGAAVVQQEFARAGAVGAASGSGMGLVAPTILEHGSDEVKRLLLRRILTGEDKWCQLFSEPGNGSDLAGLTTRAERDGDEWVVNGQKVWTTGAGHAAYGMLLARTDRDAPKHDGITWFAFPMRQSGVEVRPLRQMNFHASFNEVFLTDARVPDANAVGAVGDGWRVARTTLGHERGLAGRIVAVPPNARGRTAREATAEAADYLKTYEWYPQRAGRPDLTIPQARVAGLAADRLVRQDLARLVAVERTARWSAERARAARARGASNGSPGPEGSIAKLCASEIARASARLHTRLAGAAGMLAGTDPHAPADGVIAEVLISVPAVSIAGGTDEIQHNIIGERSLGLPKEPDAR